MNNRLRNILAAGIIAITAGCYEDKVREEKETKNLEIKVVSSLPTKVDVNTDTSYVEKSIDYNRCIGRKIGIFNEETGLKGKLKFNNSCYGDGYIVTKKRKWQNEC